MQKPEYTLQDERGMNSEYVTLLSTGKYPGTIRLIDDYGRVRKMIDACNGIALKATIAPAADPVPSLITIPKLLQP